MWFFGSICFVVFIILGKYKHQSATHCERKWYILTSKDWSYCEHSDKINQLFELHSRNPGNEYKFDKYTVAFDTKNIWKMWITYDNNVYKLKYVEQ